MNKVPIAKKVQIINMLNGGMSLRAASTISGCSINTVTCLLRFTVSQQAQIKQTVNTDQAIAQGLKRNVL